MSEINPIPTFSPSSYVSFVAVSDLSSLNWAIFEGTYTVTATLTTSGIPAGTELYWTTGPGFGSTVTVNADDFTDGQIQGRVTIDAQGKGIITRTARADQITEGTEFFKLEIRETSYTSPVMITSTSSDSSGIIGIADTSLTPKSYDSFVGVTDDSSLNYYISEVFNGTVTFTLTTRGIAAGTTVYWTTLSVTGTITVDDFTDSRVQGTVNIGAGGITTITRTARADLFTEGSEIFKLEIRETSYTSPVVITSTGSATGIYIGDSSQTPATPTYAVAPTTPGVTSVNEGSPIEFTVTTTGVTTGTSFNWAVSNAGDFATSDGSVTIGSNGRATFSVTPQADTTTEPGTESFTASIYTGSITGTPLATSVSITINDTSQTPPAPTYDEIVTMTSPIQRGTAVSFTITGGKPNTNYSFYTPYTNSSGQLNSSGNASGTIPGNAHPVAGTYNYEWYFSDTTHYRYVSVTATAPPITYVSLVGVSDNSSSSTTINEGQYTVTFTLTTTDAQDDTLVYWTTLGSLSVGTITADDFTDGLLQGEATIRNNTATIVRTARADLTTEGSDIFRLEIRETSYTSQVKATSGPILISDTSTTPPAPVSITYESFVGVSDLEPGSTTISEGQYTVTFTLTTTGGVGTPVYWVTLPSTAGLNADDFTDGLLQGTVNIGAGGITTITRTARADLFTEGPEVFSLAIRETSYTSTNKITSNFIGIADSSKTPLPSYTSFVGVTDGGVGYTWYIGEGVYTATFTLTTANVPDNYEVFWTTLSWSGTISANDFTDNTLEGSVRINDNTATITRTARADLTTEGSEGFKLEIREGSVSGAVKITSTSSDATGAIYIGDSSTTPIAGPTYAVAAPAGVTSVDEGASIEFTVTTTNVAAATRLYWSLSNAGDFATSTGTVDIDSNGIGKFTVIPRADTTTETAPESFIASISTTNGGSSVANSSSITINDTSKTPSGSPTYAVAPTTPGVTSVNEGAAIEFTITTTNVALNTPLNWAVSNAGDFATSTSSVNIDINGRATFSVTPRADTTTEPVAESFIASIYTGVITGTPVASSSSITINDTSKTPGVAITYVSLTHGDPVGINIYEPPTGASSTATFILTTENAPDNTTVYWTTNLSQFSGSNSPPTAADFIDNTLQGEAKIVGNTATITRTVRADFLTEAASKYVNYESFRIEIREDSYVSPVKIISPYVSIIDNSTGISNVTVTPATTTVDEGQSITFAVTTVGAFDGATLYWSISKPDDFIIDGGPFTITSNAGSFTVSPSADQFTDGVETFTASVLSDPFDGIFSPTIFKTSIPVTINDLSLTRSYTITPSITPVNGVITVNEGTQIDFNVTTVNVPDGITLFWSVTNSGDFSNSAGSVIVQSNKAKFSVTPVLDYVTETPAETFTASISLTSGGVAVYTTGNITIGDILGQPIYTITPVDTTVIEGSKLRFDISTTNVPAGTLLYWTVSNPVAVVPPPTPVYIITPAASSVNEGATLRINISGSNIPDGIHYWTIGTNAGDFGVTSGDFTITTNAGFFDVSPTADVTTEPTPETFTVTIRTGSITGIPVVTTNPAITINDSSKSPAVPTYAVSTTPTSVNEGVEITFTVTTTNVANGTVLNWAVTNAGDFAVSDGTVTIAVPNGSVNGTGTFKVTPRADATTETTPETFVASVYTGSITGLPVASSNQITINDTSQTPVSATYAVAAAGGATSVSEGVPITFNVTTTNILNGTTLNWAINNLLASNTADFANTSGTVSIVVPNGSVNGSGTFTVVPVADATTETVIEKFTVAIYTGSITGTPTAVSGQITITDSSQTPLPPTYAVAPTISGVTTVNEGSPIEFTVTTTNLLSPTTLYWRVVTNAGDFTNSTGEVIINNNTGKFSVTPTADSTTEITPETFRVGVRAALIRADNDAESVDITIIDTSQTPIIAGYVVAPTTPGVTSVDEGVQIEFTITTTNVANGTLLYWAYKTGSADAADLTPPNGSVTINNLGRATFTVTPIADATTEGSETFSISLRTSPAPADEVTSSISIIINDISLTPVPPESAVYAVAPTGNITSVNEGTPIQFTVTTTNVANGTPLYWSVNNSGDFGNSSGTVIINTPTGSVNGSATFSVTPIADATNEGPETFRAIIRSVSSSGDVEAISFDVTINDTSRAPVAPNPPTYSVTPSASTVNEGDELTFTVTTTNVAANTILSWSITNSGDFGLSSGFVTIGIDGTATFKVTPALDLTTEGSSESFIASIFTSDNIVEPAAVSSAVSIVDTSQGPPPDALPEYYIVPAALAVNEGTPLIITVNTLNVDPNTRLWWSVNGTVADFDEPSGSVLIDNVGTGRFSVTPTQDNLVEPAETFTITIRSGSSTGNPEVTSDPITINAGRSLSQLFGLKITPTVYNNARTQIAGVLGVTTTGQVGATQGYGQVLASSPVAQYEKITEAHLDNLRLDIVKTTVHQSDADPNLVNVALGNLELADVFDSYSVLATTCNTLKDQIGPNQLAVTSYTQTASYSAYTGTPNTGGGWKNYAFYETTVTFATADAARYFFNAGSSFKFSASRTGGTVAPTVGLDQNTSWTNLLLAVTAENPIFAKNNFYALTNTYASVYNKNAAGKYNPNYYRISAKSNVADNSYGGATVVTFKIEFVDAFNDGNSTNYDGVDGTFDSIIVRSMPKGVGLGGAISVSSPTNTTFTPSNGFTVDGTPIYITATYQITANPTSVSEASATINFTFTASNYNVPNTVTWYIVAKTQTGNLDFVTTGWSSRINDDGYQELTKVTSLTPQSTFASSITTTSIVTNPDALTEGPEDFDVYAIPTADGSGGGSASAIVTITVTDSSKTATPGYSITPPTVVSPATELSCIPGEGLGAFSTWTINSTAFTGAAPLVIYGIYLDISSNSNINAYKITLWDSTVITETTTTYYTLPTPKSVANGANVTFTVQVGSTSGSSGTGTVLIRFRTNAGTFDGDGPNTNGPSFNTASRSVSVRVVAPAPNLVITANPTSVSYNYISGNTGSASTEITVTNNGNARATLSNWNVSNPGGGSVSQGLISGLILAGGTKSTTVTYSTTSAYSGTSVISITGENALTGTVNANRNVAVTATQAFGIISQRFSLASTFSGNVASTDSFFIIIDNSGLAPLTVTNITLSGATNMTINPPGAPYSVTIPSGSSQQYNFTWNRSRIGSSTVVATITSNTGGVAGTVTSTSATFTGTATSPAFLLNGSGPGNVSTTSWLSNDGVLPKEGSIRLAFAGLEPNAPVMVAMFWTQDQTSSGYGGKGGWATSDDPANGGVFITDPKSITSRVQTSSTGTYIPWPGADPIETRYWRAGRNRFYVQLPIGKTDAGVQQWYTNSRSGTSAGSQWAITTSFPEAACGSNQTWIGFTVIPNITWGFGFYEGVQGDTFAYVLRGAASHASIVTSAITFTVDTGTTTAVPWSPPAVMTESTGQASFTFNTGVSGPYGPQQAAPVGTYNYMRPISPSGWGDATTYEGVGRTFDVLSPELYIYSIGLPAEWGVGSAVSNTQSGNSPVGTFAYYRRIGATNGTYTNINIYAACDDTLEVYCQGVLLSSGNLNINPFVVMNKTITVTDGYSHWKFIYNNVVGPGWFALGVYLGPNLYFALSSEPAAPTPWPRLASKW